mgnify:CR=1 FL=1
MKFKSFKVIPCVCVWFPEGGVCYYEIADDQDPLILKFAQQAAPELPENIELRWAASTVQMAFRSANHPEGDESPVSGDFSGFGAVLEATYVDEEGVTQAVTFSEGSSDYMEQFCAALNALLEPVRIVSDVSGGILNGTWSDRPARVLYTSDDSDDALDFDDYYLAPMSENMYRRRHAWWLHDAELDGDTIDHFHNQVKP